MKLLVLGMFNPKRPEVPSVLCSSPEKKKKQLDTLSQKGDTPTNGWRLQFGA